MKGDPIPDPDHVARLCGGARVGDDGRVTGACFLPRTNEPYLSVNWLEPLHHDRSAQMFSVRQVLAGKGMKLGASAKLAVLQVGEIRDHVFRESRDSRRLRVLHEPESNDPSHSGIFDLDPDADLIADLIAEVVQDLYPARD